MNPTALSESGPSSPPARPAGPILLVMETGALKDRVRQTLRRVLPGCVLRETADERQAFRFLAKDKAGLIVMDEAVCRRGGMAFLERLRSDEDRPELPLILFLEKITHDLLRENLRDPAVWFLEKDCRERDIAFVALWLAD